MILTVGFILIKSYNAGGSLYFVHKRNDIKLYVTILNGMTFQSSYRACEIIAKFQYQ